MVVFACADQIIRLISIAVVTGGGEVAVALGTCEGIDRLDNSAPRSALVRVAGFLSRLLNLERAYR